MLWAALHAVIAAAGQTARNAMQRELTATLGTVGATHVRFLFGFPFALVFLAGVLIVDRRCRCRARRRSSGPGLCVGALRADRRHRADARRP